MQLLVLKLLQVKVVKVLFGHPVLLNCIRNIKMSYQVYRLCLSSIAKYIYIKI